MNKKEDNPNKCVTQYNKPGKRYITPAHDGSISRLQRPLMKYEMQKNYQNFTNKEYQKLLIEYRTGYIYNG